MIAPPDTKEALEYLCDPEVRKVVGISEDCQHIFVNPGSAGQYK
jgi:hypothetical protein